MNAVILRIPNDNFKNLYAKTFELEDEMYEWIINASDLEISETVVVNNLKELEEIMMDRLDNTNPLWELDGTDYWINRF